MFRDVPECSIFLVLSTTISQYVLSEHLLTQHIFMLVKQDQNVEEWYLCSFSLAASKLLVFSSFFSLWKFNFTYFSHNYFHNYSMFRDVPGCSGTFPDGHVPGFIDDLTWTIRTLSVWWSNRSKTLRLTIKLIAFNLKVFYFIYLSFL